MKGVIRHLRRVEKVAYPREYREMGDLKTWGDLVDYCEGSPQVRCWSKGYAIWTDNEVVDLVSLKPMSVIRLRRLMAEMAETFGSRVISADCRASTSYRLVLALQNRGKIRLVEDESYLWGDEEFRSLKFFVL